MNKNHLTCDPERIEQFLQQKLGDDEQAAFELHLDECHDCREQLEATAADDEIWSGVRESLISEPPPNSHGLRETAPGSTTGPDASFSHDMVLKLLAPTDDDRMIGRLGAYEVMGVVGSGGMGVVLKAWDRALNRYVAIKLLAPHLGSSGAARSRFSREAQSAASVVHDNVMEIYGVAEANGLPYLVMPYVRGPSLQRRLNDDGPLALVEILRIASQAAAGLAAAHAQGIVHRDVKPGNILLADGVERVKLTDFGLARAADDASLTKSGIIAGTPQYMSPEQARGETVDQRSDLFSLGSVLYAMCTGRAPFRAETSYGVLRRITDEEPRPIREINPEIPEWLCRIVARLLSKRPDDRFASAREVAALLEECVAHVQQPTVVALPEQLGDAAPSARAAGGRRSVRRWLAAAAFAIFFLLAGVVVVLEVNKGTLTIESDADDVAIRITQGDEVVERLTVSAEGTSVRVAAGTYTVEIDGDADGITIENGTVELRRGGQRIVRVFTTPDDRRATANDARSPDRTRYRTRSVEQFEVIDEIPRVLPSSEAERAIARLVLVFFSSRRALPAVLIDAGSQTLVVTTGPAMIVSDGTPAIDRMLLEIPGRLPMDASYVSESTAELYVLRTGSGLTDYRPTGHVELAIGDVLSAITLGSSSELLMTQSATRVSALDSEAELQLPERGIHLKYEQLIEIDRLLPEGTPLFKNGALAGLTLLGTRFLGDKAKKSYVVPVERIASLCRKISNLPGSVDAGRVETGEAVGPWAPSDRRGESGDARLWNEYGVTPAPVLPLTAKVLEWVGLHLSPITKDRFRDKNVFAKYPGGLDVTFVRSHGPAEKAGFHEVDIVVGLQGWSLVSLKNLDFAIERAIQQIERGEADSLRFLILRSGVPAWVDVPFPVGQLDLQTPRPEGAANSAIRPEFPAVRVTVASPGGQPVAGASVTMKLLDEDARPVLVTESSADDGIAVDRVLPYGKYHLSAKTGAGWFTFKEVLVEFGKGLDLTVVAPNPDEDATLTIDSAFHPADLSGLRFGNIQFPQGNSSAYTVGYAPEPGVTPNSSFATFPTAGNGIDEVALTLSVAISREVQQSDGTDQRWSWSPRADEYGRRFMLTTDGIYPITDSEGATSRRRAEGYFVAANGAHYNVGYIKFELGDRSGLPFSLSIPAGRVVVYVTDVVGRPNAEVRKALGITEQSDNEHIWLSPGLERESEWTPRLFDLTGWQQMEVRRSGLAHLARQEQTVRKGETLRLKIESPTQP